MWVILAIGVLALLGIATLIGESRWVSQLYTKNYWSGQDD